MPTDFDYDLLAKKIAEEQLRVNLDYLNKVKCGIIRSTLISLTVLVGLICIPLFAVLNLAGLSPFAIILIITLWYCKKHPKEKRGEIQQ